MGEGGEPLMPVVTYTPKNFKADRLEMIAQANQIISEYGGFSLTLRQLYYQFVARALISNNQLSYNRVQSLVNDARLAGMMDWNALIDRTRNLVREPRWDSPEHLLANVSKQYLTDVWAPTKRRVEVWIEKDAAIGVIESICDQMHVPYFACRGYVSQSEMWEAGQRIGGYLRNGEQTTILHIGDHDPSGLHMTLDIEDRLRLFIHTDWVNQEAMSGRITRGDIRNSMFERMGAKGLDEEARTINGHPWRVKRIALTIEQVDEYQPPPNFAKTSDSRFDWYQEQTGGLEDSWELDALDPAVMEALIADEISAILEPVEAKWFEAQKQMEIERKVLVAVKDNWETIKSVHAPKEVTS